MAERQPGSPEPADDPRLPGRTTRTPSTAPALTDAWAFGDGASEDIRAHSSDGSPASRADASAATSVQESPDAETDLARESVPPERRGRKRGARRRNHDDRDRGGILAFFRELPVLILLAFALALVLKTFVVQAFYIPSGSMEPTLMPGDRVLVEKVLYHPARGDIIVFEDPNPGPQPDRALVDAFVHWLSQGLGFSQPVDEDFIKRVIGLPGDTVELRKGKLFVNGERIPQPYLHGQPDLRDYGPKKVPAGSLFVLGDNRLNSNDSRFGLGFVPEDRVIGRAFVLIWPPSRIGWLR